MAPCVRDGNQGTCALDRGHVIDRGRLHRGPLSGVPTGDARLRAAASVLLAISFALVSAVGLLGTFINKIALLQ